VTPLFDSESSPPTREALEEGAVLLRSFATAEEPALLEEVARIAKSAPFRHLVTPGGYTMSVAMTNCGRVGWVCLTALASVRTASIPTPVPPGPRYHYVSSTSPYAPPTRPGSPATIPTLA